jgi:hypothetical protein
MSVASGKEPGSVAGVVFGLVRVLIVLIVPVTGPAAHSFVVVWSEADAVFHVGRTESPF